MVLSKQIPFLQQYWLYIISVLLCSIILKFFFMKKSSKNIKIYSSTFDEFRTADQKAEFAETNEEPDEDDYCPALPNDLKHIPLNFNRIDSDESLQRSNNFYNFMNSRRTVRQFSQDDIPIEIIHNIIKTAGTAPSGAHTEPWTYVIVKNHNVKQVIREIIEFEEQINYEKRMGKKWTTDLKPLKTNWVKEYLTEAPYLILVFKQMYRIHDGVKRMHYYNEMSVCISVGMFLTAVHNAGLVSLTSTPLNCGPALRNLLNRPANEKLLFLLPIGYPTKDCLVPDLKRKNIKDITVEFL